jgi:hypothetical protein
MKVLILESQYVSLMEDIKKERYKELVSNLLETLFGKLSIVDNEDGGEIYQHTIHDQNGEDIAEIYLGKYGNAGCKKDLTLSRDVTEKLEGYVPYFRHKLFSKVLVDYVYEQLGINCDCVQYDYDFENKVELDTDGTEYEWRSSNTRKYNVKKKKKIKESIDKKKKFLIDVMGIDFTDKIEEIKDAYDVPLEFDDIIGPDLIRRMLNYFGPMYLVDIDEKKYLYQYRSDEDNRFGWDSGDFEWFHDENGFDYVDGEISEKLGITQMGLKFSDIIDIFYNED